MQVVVLKDKEEFDLIIHGVIRDGLTINDIINLLQKRGIERSAVVISEVIRQYLKGKYVFIEEEVEFIKFLYENYNCGVFTIVEELNKKGYKKDKNTVYDLIATYGFKKGVVFSDEEKDLIHKLYCEESKSVNHLLSEIVKINPYRNRKQIDDYLKKYNLVKARRWSEEELNLLEKYYPQGGSKLCKEKGLRRLSRDITNKANILNIRCGKVARSWSEEEDAYLRENYSNLNRVELAKNLNRSLDSITNRLNRLGLVSSAKWTKEEEDIVKQYYSVGGADLCIEKGVSKARSTIVYKANSLGLVRYNIRKWTSEELAILNAYYPVGGSKLCKEKGLNRDTSVINNKASRLGLKSGVERKEAIHWSDSDVELLKQYYPIGGVKLCRSKGLNRDAKSITYKAFLMGLNAPSRSWSDSEIAILKECYPVGGVKLCRSKGLDKKRGSIYSKARELGLVYRH